MRRISLHCESLYVSVLKVEAFPLVLQRRDGVVMWFEVVEWHATRIRLECLNRLAQ